MIRRTALATLLFVQSIVAADAQEVKLDMFVTGNDLFERCTDNPAASTYIANYGFCRGYIYAAADFFATVSAEQGRPSCRKAGVTGQQVVDIVVKYLREHPEERHKPADYAVIVVLPPLLTSCANRPG